MVCVVRSWTWCTHCSGRRFALRQWTIQVNRCTVWRYPQRKWHYFYLLARRAVPSYRTIESKRSCHFFSSGAALSHCWLVEGSELEAGLFCFRPVSGTRARGLGIFASSVNSAAGIARFFLLWKKNLWKMLPGPSWVLKEKPVSWWGKNLLLADWSVLFIFSEPADWNQLLYSYKACCHRFRNSAITLFSIIFWERPFFIGQIIDWLYLKHFHLLLSNTCWLSVFWLFQSLYLHPR